MLDGHPALRGQPATVGNSDNNAMKKATATPTTRKGSTPIKVYCLPEEKQQIEANAAVTGLSASTYLLKVGLGYRVRGILDHHRVEDLARINGDLGRLGGLLKLWLMATGNMTSGPWRSTTWTNFDMPLTITL